MKNKNVAGLLAGFLGGIGVHKFYLGKPIQGLMYLIFSFTFIPMVISFLEALTYFFNSQEWFDNHFNGGISTKQNTQEPTADLEKISILYEKGHLSKEEFESKKEILLKKIA